MRELTELSGPWTGQSIQDGIRLVEKITLLFDGNYFTGDGSDRDGLFDLDGEYDPSDQAVQITRRYRVSPRNPSQVGYPFYYIGKWDGQIISGRWMMSSHPGNGGPFEMWPADEEVAFEQYRMEEPATAGR